MRRGLFPYSACAPGCLCPSQFLPTMVSLETSDILLKIFGLSLPQICANGFWVALYLCCLLPGAAPSHMANLFALHSTLNCW